MDELKATGVAEARDYFTCQLKELMEKRQVAAKEYSVIYIADLLLRYMESEKFFVRDSENKLHHNILADLYAEFIQGNEETKRMTLRRLGDICLLMTGLFADYLNRKLVDLDYYFGMGGTAYQQLAHLELNKTKRSLFAELSVKFKPFSNLLNEMNDRSNIQSNTDLLRLYEKWLLTGSDHLRELLAQNGLTSLIPVDPKVRH
ncbi:MAG: hypothetical protein HY537_13260 [Deltaproteobacteria bacterium]|nr:hypothetical protein [Deltaproteobacteria bacterium]